MNNAWSSFNAGPFDRSRRFGRLSARGSTCPETASRDAVRAYHARMTLDRRCRLPRVEGARRALRRPPLHRRHVDRHLLPAGLPRAHAAARELPLLRQPPRRPSGERFRPCMNCRPELAPGAAGLVGDGRVAHAGAAGGRAARQLGAEPGRGACCWPRWRRGSASATATCAASSMPQHGVTPLQYLQTRRLLLAKQLLTDTRAAGDAGGAGERLSQPAPLQRRLCGALPHEPDAAAQRARNARHPARCRAPGRVVAAARLPAAVRLRRRAAASSRAGAAPASRRWMPPRWRRTLALEHRGQRVAGWIAAALRARRAARCRCASHRRCCLRSPRCHSALQGAFDLDADPLPIAAALTSRPLPLRARAAAAGQRRRLRDRACASCSASRSRSPPRARWRNASSSASARRSRRRSPT